MNARQRRQQRRRFQPIGCGRQGYSGTTTYPDLMCTDGYMSDMDADGYDPSTARQPCADCNPVERAEWDREQRELGDDAPSELPEGLFDGPNGSYEYKCRSCGVYTEWPGEVTEFDINNPANVCGSQYCLP